MERNKKGKKNDVLVPPVVHVIGAGPVSSSEVRLIDLASSGQLDSYLEQCYNEGATAAKQERDQVNQAAAEASERARAARLLPQSRPTQST